MRRNQGVVVAVVVAGLLVVPALAVGGDKLVTSKTIKVDCSKGGKISKALEDTALELTIEVDGVCAESVLITRDRVTLRGVGSGATIDGTSFPTPTPPGILVTGAANVSLENLMVRHWGRGVWVQLGAGVSLLGVAFQDNGNGLLVQGSAVKLREVTVERSGGHGIWIGEGAHAVVEGTLVTTDNGGTGLVISGANLEFGLAGRTIESRDNGLRGITFQVGAGAQLHVGAGTPVIVSGNGHAGVAVYGACVSIQQLDSTGNGHGIWVEGASSVEVTGTIADNMWNGVRCGDGGLVSLRNATVSGSGLAGVRLDGECRATLTGVTVQGNTGAGLRLDGASTAISNTTISGNTGTDVVLGFGSRASFDGGNSVGSVSCDGTELVRGDVSCPPVSSSTARLQEASSKRQTARSEDRPERPLPEKPQP